jgi:mRNA interferase RelE/StbE
VELVLAKSFSKELKKCPSYIQKQVFEVLEIAEKSSDIYDIPGCEALKGTQNKGYFKIRVGDWRIGLRYHDGQIHILHFITVASRGDIYKHFPPK